ncbi:MAG: histidine kinase [Cytophagales bacterium]|nr:histidine kinase [Cytophagales bacterium]
MYALREFGWRITALDSFVTNVLLAGTCLLISNNLRYYRPEKDWFVSMMAWCLLLALLWLGISYWILASSLGDQAEYLLFFRQTVLMRFGVAFLSISWVALLSVLWYNQQDQQAQLKRQAEAEKLAREAELYKLRQQLQPHFLFNSLNSISALVGSRPEEARRMIHQLSDFLRGTLKKEEEQQVTLAEELAYLELYLSIEKVRFGHRLRTETDCDPAAAACRLPSMLLQPIVENAIKFGLYDTTDGVTIRIRAQAHPGENRLTIQVQNPFDPLTAQPRQGTGFGLAGIERRLFLLFARHDLLRTRAEGAVFTTTLTIPQS